MGYMDAVGPPSLLKALVRGLDTLARFPPNEKRALESRYGDICPGRANAGLGDVVGEVVEAMLPAPMVADAS